jgi:hypothetical protein
LVDWLARLRWLVALRWKIDELSSIAISVLFGTVCHHVEMGFRFCFGCYLFGFCCCTKWLVSFRFLSPNVSYVTERMYLEQALSPTLLEMLVASAMIHSAHPSLICRLPIMYDYLANRDSFRLLCASKVSISTSSC